MNSIGLARGLGWFSLGLGAIELAAPETIAVRLGVPGGPRGGAWVVRLFGIREVAAGLTVLARPWSSVGPVARVAGDALDLALLATALTPAARPRRAIGAATALVLAVTVLDVLCVSALALRNERALAGGAARSHPARRRDRPAAHRRLIGLPALGRCTCADRA